MSTTESDLERERVLLGGANDAGLSAQLRFITSAARRRFWWPFFVVTGSGTLLLFYLLDYTIVTGIGVSGTTMPVAWGFTTVQFVWWIGIGHAGTFISALLILLEQKWRTSISRLAEAMAMFAVLQAALFLALDLGRPWFAYWLLPYPATTYTWPNFKSTWTWDAIAVFTCGTISFVLCYMGLLPDLALIRDRAPNRAHRILYGIAAVGWRGSVEHWRHYRVAYGLLAGIAASLAIAVHSVVSSGFATTLLPGWHSTLFPLCSVASALSSGFAMLLTLLIPARSMFGMHDVITERHLDNLAKLTLVTSWVVIYSHLIDLFIGWYSAETYDRYAQLHAFSQSPSSWVLWIALLCDCVVPQLLGSYRVRHHLVLLWGVSVLVNLGVWGERFSLVVLTLQQGSIPSSWGAYHSKWIDWELLAGAIAFFFFLFLLSLRVLPFIPLSEARKGH